MRYFETIRDWKKERPSRWFIVLSLIILTATPAFAWSESKVTWVASWDKTPEENKRDFDEQTAKDEASLAASAKAQDEKFHQQMIAEGKARGLDGEQAYKFATGKSAVSPYDTSEGLMNHEVARFKANYLPGQVVPSSTNQEMLEAYQNMAIISENPKTLNGTPVGLSGFSTPTVKEKVEEAPAQIKPEMPAETVKTSAPPTNKETAAPVKVVEVKLSKPLVSYDSAHQDSSQKK